MNFLKSKGVVQSVAPISIIAADFQTGGKYKKKR